MRQGLGLLGRRQYASAFRLFCFGFAAYPSEALRIRRTWQLGALLALGPLAKVVAPILYRRRSSGVFAEFTG
jgi:hypothetical protein